MAAIATGIANGIVLLANTSCLLLDISLTNETCFLSAAVYLHLHQRISYTPPTYTYTLRILTVRQKLLIPTLFLKEILLTQGQLKPF